MDTAASNSRHMPVMPIWNGIRMHTMPSTAKNAPMSIMPSIPMLVMFTCWVIRQPSAASTTDMTLPVVVMA